MWIRDSVVVMMLCGALPAMAAGWEGTVQWGHPTTIGTTLSGTVEKVSVKTGEHVRKGQELLHLEQAVPRARVEQQKARVAHSALRLSEAQKELARSEELYERTLLSDHDLNAARIAHAEAKSLHLEAKVALAEAEQQLRDTVIRSPYNAVVLSSHIEEGESVNGLWQVQSLYTIVPAEKFAVRFSVALAESAKLQPGMAMKVQVGGKSHAGKIESVTRDMPGGTSLVEVALAAEAALSVGMPAVVTLP